MEHGSEKRLIQPSQSKDRKTDNAGMKKETVLHIEMSVYTLTHRAEKRERERPSVMVSVGVSREHELVSGGCDKSTEMPAFSC